MQQAITKKQLYSLLLILGIVLFLPIIIFFLGKRQDIRPRALLAGQANFLLDAVTTNVQAGQNINVLVSMALTDASVKVSGVDFTLLYDSSRLKLNNVSANLGSIWTETPLVDAEGKDYSQEPGFKFARVALVANKNTGSLTGGTVSLASVSFQALTNGDATIKFPDDNSQMQVVGIAP